MQTLIPNPSEVNAEAATYQFSRSRGLVAKWIRVDGKLVCKWVLAESQENTQWGNPIVNVLT